MRRIVAVCFALLFVVSLFSGCATWNRATGREETPKPKSDLPNRVYYGFPDIPIPRELTFSPEKSFIYETQSIKVGVLVLSGNVEPRSLDDYFKVNMVKNGWRFVNNFKFRGDIAVNYIKEEKTASIKISRDSFTTEVEIWVGPAVSLDKGGMQRSDGVPRQP